MSDSAVSIRQAAPGTPVDVDEVVTSVGTVARQRVDVSDRAGRVLGVVSIDGAIAVDTTGLATETTLEAVRARAVVLATEATVAALRADVAAVQARDVTDRAARLLGVVSGPLTDAQLRATPVPVSGTFTTTGGITNTEIRATPLPVSGSVVATGPLTDSQLRAASVVVSTGGLTDTQLRSAAVPVSGPATNAEIRAAPVAVSGTVSTGGLTDAQMRAAAVPVSASSLPLPTGAATAAGQAATQPRTVTGTVAVSNLPATQPVSGPLTDAQLRAVAVPVSGTVAVTGGLTDAQLRAAAVPVSGTVTTGGLTDAQLRAVAVAVSAAALPLPAGAATEATTAKRFNGGKNSGATTIAASGNNTILAPTVGARLTLYWIFLSSSQNNSAEVLATVRLGAKVIYRCFLGNPGAFGHWEPVVADAVNDALIVELSAAGQSVAVSYTTSEA